MLNPLQKRTIVDEVISTIIEMVDKRILSPGDKLYSERELAVQLGVSRTSIREALKALSFVRLVEIRPGDGTYLTNDTTLLNEFCLKYDPLIVLNGIDYQKAYECRKLFESEVTYLAAQRATPNDIKVLEDSIRLQEQLLSDSNTKEYQLEDLRFHRLIARCTQNKILYDQVSVCLKHLASHRLPIDKAWETWEDHKQILEAIRKKKASAAKKASDLHLLHVGANLDIVTQLNK